MEALPPFSTPCPTPCPVCLFHLAVPQLDNIIINWLKKKRWRGLPRWHSHKESICQCRRCKRHSFNPWVRNIPWSKKQQSTPVFLPGKFQGQRSLIGYSLWGHTELDTTEHMGAWSINCLFPIYLLNFRGEEGKNNVSTPFNQVLEWYWTW